MIYVITKYNEFEQTCYNCLVCSDEQVILDFINNNHQYLDKYYCRVYNSKGNQINHGYLHKTYQLQKITL